MTTSTPSRTERRSRGFTLAEIMITTAISGFILAGVLSTFLFLGRSGANIQNYNDMEAQARKALETFAEDTRQASAISWGSNTSVTLTVNSASIIYFYDSTTNSFYRRTSTGTTALVTGIITFNFTAYTITGSSLPLDSAADLVNASARTKQLQVSLESTRNSRTVSTASNTVLSARFILRNKRVTA